MKQKFLDELKMKSKKISAFLFANLISVALLFSEIDLKSMADSDLVALQEQIKTELSEREQAKKALALKNLEEAERMVIPEEYLNYKANDDFTEVTIYGFYIDERDDKREAFENKDLEIPTHIQGIPVKRISTLKNEEYSFFHPQEFRGGIERYTFHIKSLYIPDGIILDEGAFENSYIDEVRLPEDMEEIPARLFNESGLNSIRIPAKVKKIGSEAFRAETGYYWAKCLKSVFLSEGLEEIGYEAFYGQDNLESIDFPNSLKIIKEKAFANDDENVCKFNGKLILPKNLEYLDISTFANKYIHTMFFPKSIKAIGVYEMFPANHTRCASYPYLEAVEFEEGFSPYISGENGYSESLLAVMKGEKIEKSLLLQKKLKSVKCNLENKKFMIKE